MKLNLYSFLILFFSGLNGYAQISITSDNYPSIGSVFQVTVFDYVEGIEGASGENKVWDFSGIGTGSPGGSFEFIGPAGTPFAGDYYGADIVLHETESDIYIYEKFQYGDVLRMGNALQVSQGGLTAVSTTVYDDPHYVVNYPLEYGNYLEDDLDGITYSTYVDVYREGGLSFEVDGYGTLILPDGTSYEALRVNTYQNITDSYTFGGIESSIRTETTTYGFFVKELKYQVLSVTKIVQTNISYGIEGTPVESNNIVMARESTVNALANHFALENNFVYPNPASQNVKLKLPASAFSKAAEVKILNMEGLPVLQKEYENGESIEVSGLESGIYMLSVKVGENIYFEKLAIN